MTDEVRLPARLNADASLPDLIRAFQELQDWVETREPEAFGGTLNKFLTVGNGITAGIITYSAGGVILPAPTSDVPVVVVPTLDASPPTDVTGLAVAAGVAHFMVTIDAPTYTAGGGNGRTVIYSANYSGSGPLPVFADAVEIGAIPVRGTILVVTREPGVEARFWAKAETLYPTLQATPTGGLNGVAATADLIEDQHVVSLTAAKLTAGSIGVSEYIQSTGFVSGSAGWRIDGNGNAEFSGVVVRGTLYATTLSGALSLNTLGNIKAGQTDYATGTGFFLGYSGAAYKFSIGSGSSGLTWDGTTMTLSGTLNAATGSFAGSLTAATGTLGTLTIASGGNIKLGQTAYATGTGFWLGDDSGTTKFSIGSATSYMRWDGTDLLLTKPAFDAYSASITGGDLAAGSVASGAVAYGTRTVVPSGGKSGYSYFWVVTSTSSGGGVYGTSGFATDTISISGSATGTSTSGVACCFVMDANGRVTTATFNISATHA